MSKGLDPVGKCIYCGVIDGQLSSEHILPYGLAGNRQLPKASCPKCSKITAAFEGVCLRSIMGNTRITMKLRTRKPKSRPTQLPVVLKQPGIPHKEILVDAGSFPVMLALPKFPKARVLRGLDDDGSNKLDCQVWIFRPEDDVLTKYLGNKGANSIVVGQFETSALARMVAKIAHGFAVAEHGVDGFEHCVTDLVLGEFGNINYLVGCEDKDEPASSNLHEINTYTHNKTGTLAVKVRLFASLGAPTFHVVVGRLR